MKLDVLTLRPTQFAVGMEEVRRKADRYRKLSKKELEELVDSRPVPVVRWRSDECFIVDHHHFVRALWEIGTEKAKVELRADFSHLAEKEFWQAMLSARFSHLFDQFGGGPHPPSLLPWDVRGLADDPYRSLAWAVRRAGGFEKTNQPFSDFRWADFFRTRLYLGRGPHEFQKAVAEGLKLAKSEAKKL